LVDALTFFNYSNGIILTLNQEDTLSISGKKIAIMPVWKWITR
jgi:hypothetical protein